MNDVADRPQVAMMVCNVGFALLELGRYADAVEALAASLEESQATGFAEETVCALQGLAAVCLETGRYEAAALIAGAADGLAAGLGLVLDAYERSRAARTLGTLERVLGERALGETLERGRGWDVAEAIAFALAETTDLRAAAA
jgi:tetratricopeptide (TPR) repeat protein